MAPEAIGCLRRNPLPAGTEVAVVGLRAVVFDLNGVIIEEGNYGQSPPPARAGILALVAELRAAGILLAVATSGRRATAQTVLARLGLAADFSAVAGLEDVGWPKPDPAVYRVAVTRLGVDPGDAVAIEDSLRGVRSAKAAGLRVVALSDGDPTRLYVTGADLVVSSPTELDLRGLLALAGSVPR